MVKAACLNAGIELRIFDLETVDGLAEAMFADFNLREALPVIRIVHDGELMAVLHTTRELGKWLRRRKA